MLTKEKMICCTQDGRRAAVVPKEKASSAGFNLYLGAAPHGYHVGAFNSKLAQQNDL